MSFKKKNWSALSSLARQRSIDDDEEFEKARRRRTRMHTSSTDNEAVAEEQHASENSVFNEQEQTSPRSEDESVPFAEMLKRREEDKRRSQREALQSLKLAKLGSKSEGESEQGNESEKQEIKEVRTKTTRKQSEDNYTKKLSASSLKENESNNRATSTQNHSDTGSVGHQTPLSPIHTTRAFISLGKPKEVKSRTKLIKQLSMENNECPQEEDDSRKIENDIHKSQSKSTEIRRNERGRYEKLQEDAHQRENTNNTRLQNEKCGVQQERMENTPDHSRSNSSPFRRSCPRAASFRVTNAEVQKPPLQRSASVRIPARTSPGRLDGILEKYAKAIEKSDGVKSKPSPSDYLSRPLEGVASKRCVFEKEDVQLGSPRYPVTRKDIRPGDVASKRSLWENKAESLEKDIRPGDVASKRSLWENKAESLEKDHHSFRKSYNQRLARQNEKTVNYTDRGTS